MPLDSATLSRRVLAARSLAGFEKQTELGELMVTDGHGLHDVGKWERADPTAPPMTPARAASMGRRTGLPDRWFLEPDLSKLFADPEAPSLKQDVDRLDRHLRELEIALVEADLLGAEAIDRILDSLGTTEQPQGEAPREDGGLQRG